MKLLTLVASLALSSTAALAKTSFSLSEQGTISLGALQGYAEVQSKSYVGFNYSDYAVPSNALFQSQIVDSIKLDSFFKSTSDLKISSGVFLNSFSDEVIVSLSSLAVPSDYFSESVSELVSYSSVNGNFSAQYKGTAKVHSGAYDALKLVWNDVYTAISDIKLKFPDYKITLLGHSYAGPIAGLIGLELELLGLDTTVITFGSPRFGDSALSEFIDLTYNASLTFDNLAKGIISGYIRHTHDFDIITALPTVSLGYDVHGLEVFLSSLTLPITASDVIVCSPFSDNCDGLESLTPPNVYAGIQAALASLYQNHVTYYTYLIPGKTILSDITIDFTFDESVDINISDLFNALDKWSAEYIYTLLQEINFCLCDVVSLIKKILRIIECFTEILIRGL